MEPQNKHLLFLSHRQIDKENNKIYFIAHPEVIVMYYNKPTCI